MRPLRYAILVKVHVEPVWVVSLNVLPAAIPKFFTMELAKHRVHRVTLLPILTECVLHAPPPVKHVLLPSTSVFPASSTPLRLIWSTAAVSATVPSITTMIHPQELATPVHYLVKIVLTALPLMSVSPVMYLTSFI